LAAWQEVKVFGEIPQVAAEPADIVFLHGNKLTMESDHPLAEAIALKRRESSKQVPVWRSRIPFVPGR
jgi:hypothetical protein